MSFCYRYLRFVQNGFQMAFKGNMFDGATMFAHFLLSSSSLIFHVLPRRIISRPMIIWEEYRLHAIVFTMRSVTVYLHGVWRPLRGSTWEPLALFVLVMSWHVMADEITRRFSDGNHTTVRIQVSRAKKTTSLPALFFSLLALCVGQELVLCHTCAALVCFVSTHGHCCAPHAMHANAIHGL